ncbi:uncharacterized protein TrAFT101_010386 [Trichoderma asperellum]|uniref:uncharacterized protein n=1 Tax=Trichoderma asperellum TaxID=101201 RepID=UPI00331D3E25|nr:hypothetical protein TrAFT101_010386 [Trichoderma asperellum]
MSARAVPCTADEQTRSKADCATGLAGSRQKPPASRVLLFSHCCHDRAWYSVVHIARTEAPNGEGKALEPPPLPRIPHLWQAHHQPQRARLP